MVFLWILLMFLISSESAVAYLFSFPKDGEFKSVTNHNFLREHQARHNLVSASLSPYRQYFTDECSIKFDKRNNGKYEMVPGLEGCLIPPDLNKVIKAFWRSGDIETVTDGIYRGSNIVFEKMTYDKENKEYELTGKFKKGSHMFWKVKADGNLFMKLSGINQAIGFLGPNIEISGKISSNEFVVDVIATKKRDYFEITKFDRKSNTKMMDFFEDIESTLGASSFTGSHSYMKAETFDDLSWSTITGVGRYDKNKFEVVLQTKDAEYPQTKEKSEMYFIINGDGTTAKNFAFVGLFTSGEIQDTWNKVTTKELEDIEFKRVLDYKKWCLAVSAALFTPGSYNILEPVRKYIKELREGTTFKVQADGVKAFCAKDINNKGKIITGHPDQSGIYWEYPKNSMKMHLVDIQKCLKADTVSIVLPKFLSSNTESAFYLEDIYSSGSYINIQIRIDGKDITRFKTLPIKFESFVLNYAIDIGDEKWSLRMDLKTIFGGIPLHATVAAHTDNWMFTINFPTTSVNKILKEYDFDQFSFEKGGNALTTPIKNCFLSISSGDTTVFRIKGLLGTVSLGDVTVEIMYVHDYGIAFGIKAYKLEFESFLTYIFNLEVDKMPWMSPFDLKLTASYMKEEVSHQLEDTELSALTVGKAGFSLNLVIEKTSMDPKKECTSICSIIRDYVFTQESSKITLSGSYMEKKLTLKGTLTLNIEITTSFVFSNIELEMSVSLDGSDMGIVLSCTFNYYTAERRKIELKGTLSASLEGVQLSFLATGYIKEPLGAPFTIKDASIDASIDFSSGFTLGIGGTMIFGKFEEIKNVDPCNSKDTICVTLYFGLNPTHPLQSYISVTSSDDLTIDNIAKVFDIKPPEFLLGEGYGFKGGFEFSISKDEVPVGPTFIRKGMYFNGPSFKCLAVKGQVKLEISDVKFEFNLELDPLHFFNHKVKILQSKNSKKKKIYLKAKIEKQGDVLDVDIHFSGRLVLFGADILDVYMKVDKNGLTIKQEILGFKSEINFSLYEIKVLSGKITLTQKNVRKFFNAKERNLHKLKKKRELENQKGAKYLLSKITGNGKNKKLANELMLDSLENQIQADKINFENVKADDNDRCIIDCAKKVCKQISLNKENVDCYESKEGDLYDCLYYTCVDKSSWYQTNPFKHKDNVLNEIKTNKKIRKSRYKVMAELITTYLQRLIAKEAEIEKMIKKKIQTQQEEEITEVKITQDEVSGNGDFNGDPDVKVNMNYDYYFIKNKKKTPGHKNEQTVNLKEIMVNKRTIEDVILTQIVEDNEVIVETDEVDHEAVAEQLQGKVKKLIMYVQSFDSRRLKYVYDRVRKGTGDKTGSWTDIFD